MSIKITAMYSTHGIWPWNMFWIGQVILNKTTLVCLKMAKWQPIILHSTWKYYDKSQRSFLFGFILCFVFDIVMHKRKLNGDKSMNSTATSSSLIFDIHWCCRAFSVVASWTLKCKSMTILMVLLDRFAWLAIRQNLFRCRLLDINGRYKKNLIFSIFSHCSIWKDKT